ncbi:MAG: class I SAM-dependent methyltransferase [Planctomycetota bacterium]|nr:class I SAM-dependent methyltransferase [Planctomycetota bacterium]
MKTTREAGPSTDQRIVERCEEGIVTIRSATAEEPQPADWRARLSVPLRCWHNVIAAGAKRLDADGQVFSMGEFIIHPGGFHHLGQGADGEAFRFPEEIDAICGGVFAVDETAFDRLEGDRLLTSPLGVLDLFLSLRAAGGRCVAIPEVIVTDTFSLLSGPPVTREEHEAFIARWGFDWRAADLEAVRDRHAAGGLLWNVRFFGAAMPFAKYDERPCLHWSNYAGFEAYRQRADALTKIILQATPSSSPPARVLDLGCGDGLFTHLLARAGAHGIGLDPEPAAIEQAAARVAEEAAGGAYGNGPVPEFIPGQGESLPLEPASVQTVAMLDVIEHLPNPVAILREVERVLAPGGHVVISTPEWRYGEPADAVYHVCEYTLPQLTGQLQAATGLKVCQTGRIGGAYRDLIVVARR